jgi:hypothetical protein
MALPAQSILLLDSTSTYRRSSHFALLHTRLGEQSSLILPVKMYHLDFAEKLLFQNPRQRLVVGIREDSTRAQISAVREGQLSAKANPL